MAYIAIDVDGTVVTHDFPHMGSDIGAAPVLKELVANGHQLIIFTMRSDNFDKQQFYLMDAVEWFKKNEIPLFGIQTNPTQKKWTSSPKAYFHYLIDDAAAFAPLLYEGDKGYVPNPDRRPHIDWKRMRAELVRVGYIK
jgi:hypothetical protein